MQDTLYYILHHRMEPAFVHLHVTRFVKHVTPYWAVVIFCSRFCPAAQRPSRPFFDLQVVYEGGTCRCPRRSQHSVKTRDDG